MIGQLIASTGHSSSTPSREIRILKAVQTGTVEALQNAVELLHDELMDARATIDGSDKSIRELESANYSYATEADELQKQLAQARKDLQASQQLFERFVEKTFKFTQSMANSPTCADEAVAFGRIRPQPQPPP